MTTTTTSGNSSTPVTVLGLGAMGSAIARVFLERGHPTTVWNRTASKSIPLVEAGANATRTAAEAVAASPLVVVCVLDYEAVDDVLTTVGDAIPGKALVNVTSGSPSRRATQQWAPTAIGGAVRDGEYPPDLGPLSVQAALMGDLIDHRQSLGGDTVRMRAVKELMDQRVADGHGDEGFSSLFAVLNQRPASVAR